MPPRHLRGPFDAQWNDDFHNVMHVLLTGETGAYYADFAERPGGAAGALPGRGLRLSGRAVAEPRRRTARRAERRPAAHRLRQLPAEPRPGRQPRVGRAADASWPTRDALRAATALMLLCPQIPLLFMGEETGSRSPFLFFTDFHDDLADAVREGRRREFAKFPEFSDPERREAIPGPERPRDLRTLAPSARRGRADAWRALLHRSC